MNEKEIEEFVDRLTKSGDGKHEISGAEEQGLADLWSELGELKKEPEANDKIVSDFTDKLNLYRQGWESGVSAEKKSNSTSGSSASPFRKFLFYGIAAGFAAMLILSGQWVLSKAGTLEAELAATRETLAFALLEQSSAPKRLAGLQAVSLISKPSARLRRTLVQTLDTDSNLNVRLAAVSALRALPREDALAILLERVGSEASPLMQLEILRQALLVVERDGQNALIERLGAMPLAPRVKSYLENTNLSI